MKNYCKIMISVGLLAGYIGLSGCADNTATIEPEVQVSEVIDGNTDQATSASSDAATTALLAASVPVPIDGSVITP